MKNNFFTPLESEEKIQPLLESNIELVEKKYSFVLPSSYVNFLNQQNGGRINYHSLPGWEDKFQVNFISGIRGSESDTLEESSYYIKEWNLPDGLLLLSGSGHWWICLDYRNIGPSREPRISYLDSEYNIDIVVAENFQNFIDLLE